MALVSSDYVALWKAGRFPRPRLTQALAVPGVGAAAPVYVGFRPWRNATTGTRRDVLVIGWDPRRPPFRLAEVIGLARAVEAPDTVLIDRLTRPEYGPRGPGMVGELGGRRVQIAGEFTMGAGFVADGTVLVSDTTFARLSRGSVDEVSLGLLRLAPGADAARVAQALGARLPPDMRALARPALEAQERRYWENASAIGVIFGAGVIVGFAVLTMIVYQLVSGDVTKRAREYATLKAMGYGHATLAWIGIQQALILVGAAFAGGLGLSLVAYAGIERATHIPIAITLSRVAVVLGLTAGLSVTAALVALRRLRAADPADLF